MSILAFFSTEQLSCSELMEVKYSNTAFSVITSLKFAFTKAVEGQYQTPNHIEIHSNTKKFIFLSVFPMLLYRKYFHANADLLW